ncbi:MAG: ABC transporter substrate-binding protein [Mesorhizobium sp.]|nr:ABC transporter substrate-binding protein [Mesorhizobium sp.]
MKTNDKISRRSFLVGTAIAGVIAPTASIKAQSPTPGGTVRFASPVTDISRPHALNSTQHANLTSPVLQTLTRIDENNVTQPLLCESWEASDDLKAWTLRLRKNAKWRKGRQFVAQDVDWNLRRLLDPATGSASYGNLKNLLAEEVVENGVQITKLWADNAIVVIDDHTLQLNLKTSHVALPETLSQYTSVIMDPEEGGAFGPGSNGTGPFELTEVRAQRFARYRRNESYWDRAAYLETYEIIDLGDDANTAVAALASGQIDLVRRLPMNLLPVIRSLPEVEIASGATAACATLSFDCTQEPWSDPRVRLAMRLATDRDKQLQVGVQGLGSLGEHHHASPQHPDYSPIPAFPYDPERAKNLLVEAGLGDGFDFEVYVSSGFPQYVAALQALAEDFAKIGANMTVLPVPAPQFSEIWLQRPVVMTDWAHRPLAIQMYALVYRSGVPWNTGKWSNAKFDELLAKAESIVGHKERSVVVGELEKILQEDGPIVQGFFVDQLIAYKTSVGGAVAHPGGLVFAENLFTAS